jgi:hypothetical protein
MIMTKSGKVQYTPYKIYLKILIQCGQLKWSGLVCLVHHRAIWAHVGDFGVALCRCPLNLVYFFFLLSHACFWQRNFHLLLSII